jgi:hypothetical protein
MDPLPITKADVVGNSIVFWINNTRYQVPSKMFPVASKSQTMPFAKANTVPLDNDTVNTVVDSFDFRMGHCYSNSDMVFSALQAAGFDVTYYAGWTFAGNKMPRHHAWVILKHTGGVSIIDTFAYFAVNRVEAECPVSRADENWRTAYARRIKHYEETMPNHEKMIIGKAPEGFIYVGSPDTPENAKNLFNEAIARYAVHPAYIEKDANAYGHSLLQKELMKLRY